MSYEWDFYTTGAPPGFYEWDFYTPGLTGFRACHRGPMIDVELQMSQPFTTIPEIETHRRRLLENLVDVDLDAVRTRECVLRVLNSDLGPVVARLYPSKKDLQTLICEKRNATDIDAILAGYPVSFSEAARNLKDHGISAQTVQLLVSALESKNPMLRVAGRCAIILIAAYIELDA